MYIITEIASLLFSAMIDAQVGSVELSIFFPTGSVNGATDCVNISAAEDSLLEGAEEFTLSLAMILSADALLGVPSSAVVTIGDEDGML